MVSDISVTTYKALKQSRRQEQGVEEHVINLPHGTRTEQEEAPVMI